jgi:uncharacterized protein
MNDELPVTRKIVRRPGRPIRCACLWLLLAALPLVSPSGAAIEQPALYTVEVPLDPNEQDPRADAYKKGLWEIVVRVTGSELPADAPLFEEWFPNPSRYVLQFRQGTDETLRISFDGAAIEKQLRNAGEMVWGADRPLTLVWLAVDWGQGERQIIAADDPDRAAGASRSIDRNRLLRERVQETASRRGIPVAFPLLDTEDRQNVGFADIWGGFGEQLLQASRRYQANSILLGRVRAGALQRNRWTYYFGGVQQEWNGEPEEAINLLADTLAAQFAYAGDAPLRTVTLNVAGVDSIRAYGTVDKYLQNLSLIEDFEVRTIKGDEIQYGVHLRGDSTRLRRALEISNILIPVDNFDQFTSDNPLSKVESLDFMYRPPSRDF